MAHIKHCLNKQLITKIVSKQNYLRSLLFSSNKLSSRNVLGEMHLRLFPFILLASKRKKRFPTTQTNYVYLVVSKQKGTASWKIYTLCGRDRTLEIKARKINRGCSSGLSSNRLMLRKASIHLPKLSTTPLYVERPCALMLWLVLLEGAASY